MRNPLRHLSGHLMAVLLIANLTACKTSKHLLQKDTTTAATTTTTRKDSLTAQAITLTFNTPQPAQILKNFLPIRSMQLDTPLIAAVTITTTTATSTQSAQATQTTHTQQQQKEKIPTTYKAIIILIFLTTLVTCILSTPKK